MERKHGENWSIFGCLEELFPKESDIDMKAELPGDRPSPSHLVVMVHGLVGSKSNCLMATFDGVEVMGKILAQEVRSAVKRHSEVRKISFVSHSLGGLIARYAIACLYETDPISELPQAYGNSGKSHLGHECHRDIFNGKIAGLEPMNFITIAAPHLGSCGHQQVPLFCSFRMLEKLPKLMSYFCGKTVRRLFLTDNIKTPLLLQMVSDHEDLKFISALKSFKRRVAYANARDDFIVGWRTSSVRAQNELPKYVRHLQTVDNYPHITIVKPPAAGDDNTADKCTSAKSISMEEEMFRALTGMSWERYDVDFKGSWQRYFAHATIQVRNSLMNSDGDYVIQHMVDSFVL